MLIFSYQAADKFKSISDYYLGSPNYMLSSYSFSETRCHHVPFALDHFEFTCESGDVILGNFYIGIIDSTSRPFINDPDVVDRSTLVDDSVVIYGN